MTTALVTLCLNEMEWLPKLYEQHKDWPDLSLWVFVEAADIVYAKTNPSLVNERGLSVDGTSTFLRDLAATDSRVVYVPYGFTSHADPSLGKVPARQSYLDVIERTGGVDYVVVLDADEFYMRADQPLINSLMRETSCVYNCFWFTSIWRPPSIASEPLFASEIIGGFFSMEHMKGFRWAKGMRYSDCHQHPRHPSGDTSMARHKRPSCLHMAFASESSKRIAKHIYYEKRGERMDVSRAVYCRARSTFSSWYPGDPLPPRAKVVPYTGPIPECFQ